MDRHNELEAFKTDIDLRVVAGELGYEINTKKSSRGCAVMDHPGGDRVLIALATDGHQVYCSVHDPGDHGSVIDFWQKRRGGSLGEVRKALRPYLRSGAPPPPAGRTQSRMLPGLAPLVPIERDILGVRRDYECFRPLDSGRHRFLNEERSIPAPVLALPCFSDRVRVDDRGNAVFPHFNETGLCGYEARNHGFVSFSKGGVKGLWCSSAGEDDAALVIAESAIDAISYGVIRGTKRTRFVSFSGGLNNDQPALLRRAMEQMPEGSRVVAAVDNDEAGDGYLDRLGSIFDGLGREDLAYAADRPQVRGTDWNDELRQGPRAPSLAPS